MTTTGELLGRLQRHYIKPSVPLPGGVFIDEVTYGGAGGSRCDALYVGFTSTSGRMLVGHELKVSRADWRHELDQPGKADRWADQCHAWYVVAPSTDIVPAEEVPHGWGLMVLDTRSKTRMKTAVKAQVHADRQPSWTAARSIVSRMDTLRAQHDQDVRAKALHDAQRKARESGTAVDKWMLDRLKADQETLTQVCEALGIRPASIDSYGGPTLDELRALAPILAKQNKATNALHTLKVRAGGLDALDRAVADLRSALSELTAEAAP